MVSSQLLYWFQRTKAVRHSLGDGGLTMLPSEKCFYRSPHIPLLKVLWSMTPLDRTSRRALPYSSNSRSA